VNSFCEVIHRVAAHPAARSTLRHGEGDPVALGRRESKEEPKMSQGAYVTLVGFVAQDPTIRATATGKQLTRVRVGTTPRYRDDGAGQWRDGETSYYDVKCWNRLAAHVRQSVHKGEPVIVKGKFRTSTYKDKDGQTKVSFEITADTLGHDLSRGTANYMRVQSRRANADDDRARGEFAGNPEDSGMAEGPMDPDEILDEDAIERFGRDLENDELAARAAAEETENEEEVEAGVPAASATPF
jgi:single-strand DNA-binding protein